MWLMGDTLQMKKYTNLRCGSRESYYMQKETKRKLGNYT